MACFLLINGITLLDRVCVHHKLWAMGDEKHCEKLVVEILQLHFEGFKLNYSICIVMSNSIWIIVSKNGIAVLLQLNRYQSHLIRIQCSSLCHASFIYLFFDVFAQWSVGKQYEIIPLVCYRSKEKGMTFLFLNGNIPMALTYYQWHMSFDSERI